MATPFRIGNSFSNDPFFIDIPAEGGGGGGFNIPEGDDGGFFGGFDDLFGGNFFDPSFNENPDFDPNAPSNFDFNTGEDVIQDFFTPQLNDILDQSKFTFEQIQERILNPINLDDNEAFQLGLEGLNTPIELDFRQILRDSGQQSSAKNNLLALSRRLAAAA